MITRRMVAFIAALSMLFAMGWFIGCSEDDEGPTGTTPDDSTGYSMDSEATCEGCHSNEEMLKATVEEEGDTPPPSSGEG